MRAAVTTTSRRAARELDQLVDFSEQLHAARARDRRHLAAAVVVDAFGKQVGEADDVIERRPQLVADVHQERALRAQRLLEVMRSRGDAALQLLADLLLRGDVLEHRDRECDAVLHVEHRRRRHLDCDALAVAIDFHVVDVRSLAGQRADDRHARRRIRLVRSRDVRRVAVAKILGVIPLGDRAAEELLRGPICIDRGTRGVENEDADRKRLNELRQPLRAKCAMHRFSSLPACEGGSYHRSFARRRSSRATVFSLPRSTATSKIGGDAPRPVSARRSGWMYFAAPRPRDSASARSDCSVVATSNGCVFASASRSSLMRAATSSPFKCFFSASASYSIASSATRNGSICAASSFSVRARDLCSSITARISSSGFTRSPRNGTRCGYNSSEDIRIMYCPFIHSSFSASKIAGALLTSERSNTPAASFALMSS